MPIETQWLISGRIIYVRLQQQVTQDDLMITDLMVQALLDTASTRVHSIVDHREMTGLPKQNMRQLVNTLRGLQHEYHGDFIIVSQPERMVDLFLYSVHLFTGVYTAHATTMPDALRQLAERDPALPDLRDLMRQFDE